LTEKFENTHSRMVSSEEEIQRLNALINNLSSASKNIDEVRSLIAHYKAAVTHHEDIINVAYAELEADKQQIQEIQKLMEKLNEASGSLKFMTEEKKYKQEIIELEDTLDILNEDRSEIAAILDILDPNRETNGKSKLILKSEIKKRKLESAFTPSPKNWKPTKRIRPTLIVKPIQLEEPVVEMEEYFSEPYNGSESTLTTELDGPSLLASFLPNLAIKFVGISKNPYESIEWYEKISCISINSDTTSLSFSYWRVIKITLEKHFALQSYSGITSLIYRIVAIDPNHVDRLERIDSNHVGEGESEIIVVPLAETNNLEHAKSFLDLLEELESSEKFDFDAVWRVLCSSKS